MKQKILYLSYNGMMEALGASQVLSYIYKMCNEYEFHLVSVEKKFDNTIELNKLKKKLEEKGIYYYPLKYDEGRINKNFNILKLYRLANRVRNKEKITYVHCRAYFPAVVAWVLKKQYPIQYLFDTRCFAFDERADVGLIKRDGIIYKNLKKLERKLYLGAKAINMLSYESKNILNNNELFKDSSTLNKITVIPTCVDLDRFTFHEKSFESPLKIGYVGNTVGWYNFDYTLQVIKEIGKVKDYQFIIYNSDQHDFIKEKLLQYNIPLDKVTLQKVEFKDMPEKLKEIDISVFFIRPLFSKKASAATKLGELLASGIPVITNSGVGDHEFYISNHNAGFILDINKLHEYDFNKIINKTANKQTSLNCRKVAEKFFSAEKGAEDYKKLYKELFI